MWSWLALLLALQDTSPDLPVMQAQPVRRVVSEQGQALGHTGHVVLQFTLQPDGSVADAEVTGSSRSEILDADALTWLKNARQSPRAAPARIELTVSFLPDIPSVDCAEFLRQIRWYEAAWPERTYEEAWVYQMSVGAMTIRAMQESGGMADLASRKRRLDEAVTATLASCEREPDKGYLETLREHLDRPTSEAH